MKAVLLSIFTSLLNSRQNKILYIVKALAVSLVPAILIAYLLSFILPQPPVVLSESPGLMSLVELGIVAPAIETLLMWPILTLIGRFVTKSILIAAIISALAWSLFHGLFSLTWGLTIVWPFFVFSVSFLVWKKRSIWDALLVTFVIHSLQNQLAVYYMMVRTGLNGGTI